MYRQQSVGPALAPNRMRFLFSDGTSPLASIRFKLIALGKSSGVKSDLGHDMSDIAVALFAVGNGEIAVDDARFAQGFDIIRAAMKRKRPNARSWEGVPGLPMPGSGYTIDSRMRYDPSYPAVPIVVELFDPRLSPARLRHELAPGEVVTRWKRVAEELGVSRSRFITLALEDYLLCRRKGRHYSSVE